MESATSVAGEPVASAAAVVEEAATPVAYESVTPVVYEAVEAPTPRAGNARLPTAPHVVHNHTAATAPAPLVAEVRGEPAALATAPLAATALTGVAALAALGLTAGHDAGIPRTADSLDDVPAHMRDLASLQKREQQLSQDSLTLTLERQAVLRVGRAIRRNQAERTAESKLALDDALREHAEMATMSHGLDAQSDAEAITHADVAVADRLAEVIDQRKSVSRLVSALMVHEASPDDRSESAVLDAYARYAAR